jgi:hypothetical protein
MFEFKFELVVHQIHFKLSGGNLQVSQGVELYKPCMSHLCTVHLGTLSAHCRLDLGGAHRERIMLILCEDIFIKKKFN